MLKEKSSPWARLKYLYVLPLTAIAVAAFARPEISTELDEISDDKVNNLAAIVKTEEVKSGKKMSGDGIKVPNMLVKGSAVVQVSGDNQEFQVVEDMPSFPGGMKECIKFLSNKVKYPIEAVEKGIQGTVAVRFVIEKDGSISRPEVIRKIDPYLDKEALRVIMEMPKWKPGKQKGVAVCTQYTVPIKFKLPVVDKEKKNV